MRKTWSIWLMLEQFVQRLEIFSWGCFVRFWIDNPYYIKIDIDIQIYIHTLYVYEHTIDLLLLTKCSTDFADCKSTNESKKSMISAISLRAICIIFGKKTLVICAKVFLQYDLCSALFFEDQKATS